MKYLGSLFFLLIFLINCLNERPLCPTLKKKLGVAQLILNKRTDDITCLQSLGSCLIMWQGIGVACLMSTHCKSQRGCLTFLVGTILGLTIGCTLTLTYTIQLNKVERSDIYRLPRMSLDATKMFYANIPTEEVSNNVTQVPFLFHVHYHFIDTILCYSVLK